MIVKKYGNLTVEEFNSLPMWLQNHIYHRWVECFGGEPFNLSRLYWYDIYSPTGYVFDYATDPADFLSDGSGDGSDNNADPLA